jgi:hypothetical protein
MFALFIPALMGALAVAMATFIGRAILALGVGFVTYQGIDLAIAALKMTAVTSLQGMPADMIGLAGWLYIDKGISVIFSAFVTSLSMRMVSGGLKKMVFK